MKSSINDDLARALDPILFAQTVGINPDEWQQKLLLSTKKRILLNCCRQAGKSTIVAIYALWQALNTLDTSVLILSPSLRQSSELLKKVVHFYEELNKPVLADTQTSLTLELNNGSRIVSLPGTEKTIRGYSSVSLLLLDEAALVSDDLYRSVRPMMAVSNGRLIALSTPRGKRGFFYEAWKNGGPTWERYRITADQCLRISNAFLKEELSALGSRYYEQEYFCEFHENEACLFSRWVIQRAVQDYDELEFDLDGDDGGVGISGAVDAMQTVIFRP
jgi:Terminase large subunit, T4likevirus-type, N-terminal